jgi:hypothetical protein
MICLGGQRRRGTTDWGVLSLMSFALLGCFQSSAPYYEQHELKNLRVIWLDQAALHEKYEHMSGKPALALYGTDSSAGVQSIKGFFDFRTNTIYCSKMDFTACGHELHHAIIGHFHPDSPLR